MEIIIETSTCNISLEVESSFTIIDVKDNITSKTGIHRKYQKLSFSNEILQDEYTLAHYNIGNKSTIDFQLIVPSFEEVLEATSTLKEHISCTSESTDFESEKVEEAMTTVKAFIDSHSCCAVFISDLLKTSADQSEQNVKMKMFCQNLLHKNLEITNVIKTMKKDLENVKAANSGLSTQVENLKSEVENLKSERENWKTEVENVKALNKTILEKANGFEQFRSKVEQRIENFSDALSKMTLNQTIK
ncbi:uncharacterized protein LOC119085719 [Bradysia coprophila]|uniref:uncharacterized protein LOC119085719 n=1 Tax=Bradysia coprophila TaxID=38358 RepID=UPI00187DD3EC|nr:uncharacterized protein LOC119085719 [Bradysia coprophila]